MSGMASPSLSAHITAYPAGAWQNIEFHPACAR